MATSHRDLASKYAYAERHTETHQGQRQTSGETGMASSDPEPDQKTGDQAQQHGVKVSKGCGHDRANPVTAWQSSID